MGSRVERDPDIPLMDKVGHLVDGSVFHPGDSYLVPGQTVTPSESTSSAACDGHPRAQRNPMWLVAESSVCGLRAAGR